MHSPASHFSDFCAAEHKFTNDLGEFVLPKLSNWPNQGVGRVNPDGSRGACTACHARHEFSIEMARKPFTCSQCHMGPDVPAFEVYEESKHGNIFHAKEREWNWTHVPWRVGVDFPAPTCAVCHKLYGEGAAIGAGAGAATGTVASAASPGPGIWIPAEALVTFHLNTPLTVTPVDAQEAARLAQGLYPGGPSLYRVVRAG